ncbi:hypothetical protein PAXINDRAFT_98793 [Paxillus involutus ATCC 200175]|nr:hypothetical protein PAXINDRAFT_98793 [Paxillus involutus ATCC 200175]
MSSRPPHGHARVQTQNRARAQTSPKLSIYHSPTNPRADSTARLLFRERAATVSRVTVAHRNARTGREYHHHGRPHRAVSPYTSIVASPPPSPSLSSIRDVMPDLGPSAPTRKDGREGCGRGSGIDRPPSTHGRTKSAPGAWVPLMRSHRHSQSQFQPHSQAHFRPHVHLHARRRDVSGCPLSHGGEQGTEGEDDEYYEDEASFSDTSDERRRTRYGLRDSETVLRNIGW